MDASEMGRKGGKARAKRLTAEQRRAIASKAGQASKLARMKKVERKPTSTDHRGK